MFLCAAYSACGSDHARNDDRVVAGSTVLAGAEQAGTEALFARATPWLGEQTVLAVCDGVGGTARGDRAAHAAACALASPPSETRALPERLARVAMQVHAGEQAHPANQRGCAVAAGVLVEPGEPHLACTPFWAGDARVYRYRTPYLAQLTRDHTLAQEIRDARAGAPAPDGEPDPADDPAARRTVTRWLGRTAESPFAVGHAFPLLAGDVLLVCSDGLWGALGPDVLEAHLAGIARKAQAHNLDAADFARHARALARSAQAAASTDDISLVLAVRTPDDLGQQAAAPPDGPGQPPIDAPDSPDRQAFPAPAAPPTPDAPAYAAPPAPLGTSAAPSAPTARES